MKEETENGEKEKEKFKGELIAAEDLKEGQIIETVDGKRLQITRIKKEEGKNPSFKMNVKGQFDRYEYWTAFDIEEALEDGSAKLIEEAA